MCDLCMRQYEAEIAGVYHRPETSNAQPATVSEFSASAAPTAATIAPARIALLERMCIQMRRERAPAIGPMVRAEMPMTSSDSHPAMPSSACDRGRAKQCGGGCEPSERAREQYA